MAACVFGSMGGCGASDCMTCCACWMTGGRDANTLPACCTTVCEASASMASNARLSSGSLIAFSTSPMSSPVASVPSSNTL